MKVNVLTAKDVTFRPWCWWSDWIDIAVFDYGGIGHLLQMEISRRNAKRFKVRCYESIFADAKASTHQAGDLTQMKGDD